MNDIESQILNISGNGPPVEKLYNLLNKGTANVFAGAGTSAELWPLWHELIESLIKIGVLRNKINSDEAGYFQQELFAQPLQIADQIWQKLGDTRS